eukprot:Skav223100  [mRNA]  locus=scaffold419:601092:602426:- [translate_table: standard]
MAAMASLVFRMREIFGPPSAIQVEVSSPGSKLGFLDTCITLVILLVRKVRKRKCQVSRMLMMREIFRPPSAIQVEVSSPGSKLGFLDTCITLVILLVRRVRKRKCQVSRMLRMREIFGPPSAIQVEVSSPGSKLGFLDTCITLVIIGGRRKRRRECQVSRMLRMREIGGPPSTAQMDSSCPGSQVSF